MLIRLSLEHGSITFTVDKNKISFRSTRSFLGVMAAFLRFSNEDYYQSADSMIVPIEIEFTDSVRSFEKKF